MVRRLPSRGGAPTSGVGTGPGRRPLMPRSRDLLTYQHADNAALGLPAGTLGTTPTDSRRPRQGRTSNADTSPTNTSTITITSSSQADQGHEQESSAAQTTSRASIARPIDVHRLALGKCLGC